MMNKEVKMEELELVNGGTRPYVCPVCGETRYHINSIIDHTEKMHKNHTGGCTRSW